MRSLFRATAGALAITLAATGCGLITGGHKTAESSRPSSAGTAKPGDMTGGRHYRSGWYENAKAKTAFDAHRVERYPTYSVLYIDLYLGPDPGMIKFGTDGIGQYGDQDLSGFSLIDPVAGRYYKALRQGSVKGRVFGSGGMEDSKDPFYAAGVRHPLMIYFPPLPAGTQQIDVLTPGTTGEMTGIPVLEGGDKPTLPKPSTAKPKAGQTFFYPVTPPSGKIWSQSGDLSEFVEGPSRSTTTGGDEQKIGLRTDVLFAFDKANLSPKATSVLDEAVEQTRKNADPSKPPITITGYTDSKGGDAYNIKLSRRRAAAVEKYLAEKLGTGYQYRTDGKGEADPIAANTKKDGSDNPDGRARNRRVEIAYKIKNVTPEKTTTSSSAPEPGARATPAAFHNDDGPVIGTIESEDGTRLSVHPFYRDGKYMVGVYTVRGHGGPSFIAPPDQAWVASGTVTAMNGATFGGITAIDPATKDRYYEAGLSGFVYQGIQTFAEGQFQSETPADQDTRIFVYYPAPPANVTKVDVDATGIDKIGSVRNVPVR